MSHHVPATSVFGVHSMPAIAPDTLSPPPLSACTAWYVDWFPDSLACLFTLDHCETHLDGRINRLNVSISTNVAVKVIYDLHIALGPWVVPLFGPNCSRFNAFFSNILTKLRLGDPPLRTVGSPIENPRPVPVQLSVPVKMRSLIACLTHRTQPLIILPAFYSIIFERHKSSPILSYSSFPVIHKVDNVGFFCTNSNGNKLEVVTNGINLTANLHLS